ncbi:hypothetical protein ACQU0X_31885 [Pseudovibrio ascidiaceicola]|uniref:hypothetical protein n=1 Tax=Pseudovibrio ascidiaceicola TaxID=285279 RepID=UPI003D369215
MRFIEPNEIEFEGWNNAPSKSLVAYARVDDEAYVGFARIDGTSPTNYFEHLAKFVWRTRLPEYRFEQMRWLDFQHPYVPEHGKLEDEQSYMTIAVALQGAVLRKSFFGFGPLKEISGRPKEGDIYSTYSPEWTGRMKYSALPPEMQASVSENILKPAKLLNLV